MNKGSIIALSVLLFFGLACSAIDKLKLENNKETKSELSITFGEDKLTLVPQNVSIKNSTKTTITIDNQQEGSQSVTKTTSLMVANYGNYGESLSTPSQKGDILMTIVFSNSNGNDDLSGEYSIGSSGSNNEIQEITVEYAEDTFKMKKVINPKQGNGSLKIAQNENGSYTYDFDLQNNNRDRSIKGSFTR